MLRAERPDVVHVCSPNYLHREHTIAGWRPARTSSARSRWGRRPTSGADGGGGGKSLQDRGGRVLLSRLFGDPRVPARGECRALWRPSPCLRRIPVPGCLRSREVCVALHAGHVRSGIRPDRLWRPLVRPRGACDRQPVRRAVQPVHDASAPPCLAWPAGRRAAAPGEGARGRWPSRSRSVSRITPICCSGCRMAPAVPSRCFRHRPATPINRPFR